jgi:membrane-associated phospholipid phosphatase
MCGTSCGYLLSTFLGRGAVHAASQHYTWYFPYMIGMVLVMLAATPRRVHHEYVLAFILLFLVGILWVYIVPTLGPAFFFPELYSFVRETESGLLQQDLWGMKEILTQDPLAKGAIYSISGFPSLHVAVVVLGTVYAFRVSYYLGLLSSSFLLLIVHSTIILGWHYVLDDIGSCLLVVLCVWIARRMPWGDPLQLTYRA